MFTNLGAEVNERIGHKYYLKTEFDNGFVSVFNQRRNPSMSEQFTLLSSSSCLWNVEVVRQKAKHPKQGNTQGKK